MADNKKVDDAKQEKTEESASGQRQNEPETKHSAPPVWDKFSDVLNKGIEALKTGAEKISQATSDTAKSTRLKIEIFNLKNENDRLNRDTGEKIWDLQKKRKLNNMPSVLAEELQRRENLRSRLKEKEKEIEKLKKA